MTPFELACRSAHAAHNNQFAPNMDPTWDGWKSWAPVVAHILQAIREPSGSMVSVGDQYDSEQGNDTWGGPQGIDDNARHTFEPNSQRIWRAMIDAAMEGQSATQLEASPRTIIRDLLGYIDALEQMVDDYDESEAVRYGVEHTSGRADKWTKPIEQARAFIGTQAKEHE